jgi:hypothetical protein
MPRDAAAITALALDANTAAATALAINATNHVVINAAANTRKLLIELTNTTAAEKVMTIKAPTANPDALRAGRGDLAITFAAGNTTPQVKYVLIESARFAQADGSINIDVAASTTGSVRVYRLPSGA